MPGQRLLRRQDSIQENSLLRFRSTLQAAAADRSSNLIGVVDPAVVKLGERVALPFASSRYPEEFTSRMFLLALESLRRIRFQV